MAAMLCKVFTQTLTFLIFSIPLTANQLDKLPGNPAVVPFTLSGNTIFAEASVNGVTGNFILDTGSPDLILNSAYFKGFTISWAPTEVVDVNGKPCKAKYFDVKELTMQGMELPDKLALVLDLSNIERIKGLPVAGILGYSAFKNVELMFDFEQQQVLLFPLGKSGYPPAGSHLHPCDSLDFKMSSHIPCISARIGEETLTLGIDTGSEINLLCSGNFKKQPIVFQANSRLRLHGISKNSQSVTSGFVSGFNIGKWQSVRLEAVVTDMKHLNENLNRHLHGILGIPFLQQWKIAINYKKKKIYLWRRTEGRIVEKQTPAPQVKLGEMDK